MLKKIAFNLYVVFFVALIAWGVLSFVDIVSDNNGGSAVHSKYNIICILEGVTK